MGTSTTRSTYRDLWEGARRVAALLQREANLESGETVALGATATREFVVAMYGAFLVGARPAASIKAILSGARTVDSESLCPN